MPQDEYLVYINSGNRWYLKNQKLHREDGPAFVPKNLKEEYTGLEDQDLYQLVFYPPKNFHEWTYNINPDVPHYFIEDIEYTKEQLKYAPPILKDVLTEELPKENTQQKKKLKV